jgi:hypothetical protein
MKKIEILNKEEYKDNNNLLKEDVVSLVNEIKELKQKDLIQKILL